MSKRAIEGINLFDLCKMNEESQIRVLLECIDNYRARTKKQENIEITCDVCYGDFKPQEMVGARCGHLFCLDCWRSAFKEHIKKSSEPMICLEQGCGCVVEMGDILKYNLIESVEDLNKYSKAISLNSFKSVIRECPQCHISMMVKSQNQKVVCPVCNTAFCKDCGDQWHEKKTCKEWREFKIAFEKAKNAVIYNENIKPCPGCRRTIYKDGGCQWMQCRGCGCYFCWICLQVTNDHQHRPGQVCRPHGALN